MANKTGALNKYHFFVVDENDNPITSGLRVSVYVASDASRTAATIYSDAYATALTNPITSTVFGTNTGQIEFWYGGPSVDVIISDGIGRMVICTALTPSQNRVVFDSRRALTGLIGNVTGTDLVSSTGAFVDYAETVTLDGSLLEAGDVVNIGGWLVIDDYNATEELDFKVFISAVTLLHTGDMVPTADSEHMRFDIKMKVLTAGASGKIVWSGKTHTDIAGTWKLQVGTVDSAVSLTGTSLDMSGDVIIKASGDYALEAADQESQVLWDVSVQKGLIYTT